jgi:hypothetical protein
LLPALAAAQEPVTSFDRLNTRLKPGDTVWLTDAQGREVNGKITELHDASITLNSNGPTTLQADSVRLITRHTGRHTGVGALWGLIGGAVAGAVSFAGDDSGDCSGGGCALAGAAILGGIGAGVGAVVGAFIPGHTLVIYRAPGASGNARLSLAPVNMPRTKGVALSYSF